MYIYIIMYTIYIYIYLFIIMYEYIYISLVNWVYNHLSSRRTNFATWKKRPVSSQRKDVVIV